MFVYGKMEDCVHCLMLLIRNSAIVSVAGVDLLSVDAFFLKS